MTGSEKRELLEHLERGRDALGEALAGVDEQMAARRPAPDRWSILECVEHLAAAEQFLFSRLTAAVASDGPTVNSTRERRILAHGAERTRPLEAPETARPADRFASLAEALAAFGAARSRTIHWVNTFDGDPRASLTSHPLIPGPVNCYEMILILSVHPVRHAQQIRELR